MKSKFCHYSKHGFKNWIGPACHNFGPVNWAKNRLNRNQTSWTDNPTDESTDSIRTRCFNYYFFKIFIVSKRCRFGGYKNTFIPPPFAPKVKKLLSLTCRDTDTSSQRRSSWPLHQRNHLPTAKPPPGATNPRPPRTCCNHPSPLFFHPCCKAPSQRRKPALPDG